MITLCRLPEPDVEQERVKIKNINNIPVQMMAVLAFPPKLFWRIRVSLLSLYGMWAELPLLSFWIT